MIRFERLARNMVSISGQETGQRTRIYRLFLGPVVLNVEVFEYPIRWEKRKARRSKRACEEMTRFGEWYVRTHGDPR